MRKGFSGDTTMGRPLRHEGDYMLIAGWRQMRRLVFELHHLHAAFFRLAAPLHKTDGAAPSAWIAEMSPMLENTAGVLA